MKQPLIPHLGLKQKQVLTVFLFIKETKIPKFSLQQCSTEHFAHMNLGLYLSLVAIVIAAAAAAAAMPSFSIGHTSSVAKPKMQP